VVEARNGVITAEDLTMLEEEIMWALEEATDIVRESEFDITLDDTEIRCTFSDLNGLCEDADRSFSSEVPSLLDIVAQLHEIDLNPFVEINNIDLVDDALSSVSIARGKLGAMFVRFAGLLRPIESEEDVYMVLLDFVNQGESMAMMSISDVMTDEDRVLLNEVFTQIRDELVRLNTCHSCDLKLDDAGFPDCEAGMCLSIETQESATDALEGFENLSEQLNQCITE
jgi:hypothetical protein